MGRRQDKIGKLPSIRRLPSYVQILQKLKADGNLTVSTTQIAEEVGVEPIVVRKDLAITGITGTPRVGFETAPLIAAIREFLGWDNTTDAFVIGAGRLGLALAGYAGFTQRGLNILAAFDNDPVKIDEHSPDLAIFPMQRLADLTTRLNVHLGILTVPAPAAQEAAERMAEAGIRGIWNFTAEKLRLPASVVVQDEDLSSGLAVLSLKMDQLLKEEPQE